MFLTIHTVFARLRALDVAERHSVAAYCILSSVVTGLTDYEHVSFTFVIPKPRCEVSSKPYVGAQLTDIYICTQATNPCLNSCAHEDIDY